MTSSAALEGRRHPSRLLPTWALNIPKSVKFDFGWPCIRRRSLRSHLRMTVGKCVIPKRRWYKLRDRLPIRRQQCGRVGLRKGGSLRSSARLIANRCRRRRNGTRERHYRHETEARERSMPFAPGHATAAEIGPISITKWAAELALWPPPIGPPCREWAGDKRAILCPSWRFLARR
jgi:hypothetical protein